MNAECSLNNSKNMAESEKIVVTQVQKIPAEDPETSNHTWEQFASDTDESSILSEVITADNGSTVSMKESNTPDEDMDDKLVNHFGGVSVKSAPSYPAECHLTESAACQDTGQRPKDVPPGPNGPPRSNDMSVSDNGDLPPSGVTSSQHTGSGGITDQVASQQDAQARLQEAIEKVEQLDRSLEKKLKENLEAKAVTADLRALVRRELAELSDSRGGRQVTREESDNTLQFLRVLADNDSESETSGRVTPIFQTQVRFGRGGRLQGAAGADPGPQADGDGPSDPAAGEPPPPPPPPAQDQYFIKRNIELAQEAGGSLAMTEEERCRLEQLLAEEDDQLENAFSIDQQHRRLLESLDDQLSSLGVSVTASAGSSSLVSRPAGSDGVGAGDGGPAADSGGGGGHGEPDYLEETRCDRETAARLEVLHRRLEQLAAPVEVRRLDRGDVDGMIQDTIASLVSVPCGAAERAGEPSEHSDTGLSAVSAPPDVVPESASEGEGGSADDTGREEEEERDGGYSPGPASEAPTETSTLDVRSVLSGARQDENERQLAEELRPGSPTAWLVDVSQGRQRLQLVVPRLSRQLISSLLDSSSVLPPDQRLSSILPPDQRSGSVLPPDQRPSSVLPPDQRPSSIIPPDQRPSSVLPLDQRPSSVLPPDQRPSSVIPPDQRSSSVPPPDQRPSSVLPPYQRPSSVIPPDQRPSSVPPPDQRSSSVLPLDQRPSSVLPLDQRPSSVLPLDQRPSSVLPPDQRPGSVLHPNQRPSSVLPPDQRPSSVLPPDQRPSSALPPDQRPSSEDPPDQRPSSVLPPDQRPSSVLPLLDHRPSSSDPASHRPVSA